MTSSLFLEILLLLNVFFMGALAVVAVRHAYAHFRPQVPPEKPRPHAQPVRLSPEARDKLLQAAQTNFQTVLDRSAVELQRDLRLTAAGLDKQLGKLGARIISDEMQRYHTTLGQLRQQAETVMNGAQTEISTHQTDLKAKLIEHQAQLEAKLTADITAEHQRLTQQIDTKLADAVASFLMETLQHDVDLGAQSAYLTAMLEEHKAELAKGVGDES